MKASSIEERMADAVASLLAALKPYLGLFEDEDEAELFIEELDVLLAQSAAGAGVTPVLTTLGRLARRLHDVAEATGHPEAAAQLAQIEASGLRLRDRWLNRIELRRPRA